MRNLLMISYFAPPYNIPSAVRVGKFAKFLPKLGWRPQILTVKGLAYYQKDRTQFGGLKSEDIHRTESLDPLRLLSIFKSTNVKKLHREKERFTNKIKALFPIDEKVGWMPFCFSKGKEIIRSHPIDAIFCTTGGIYNHVITSYRLAKKFHKPLIVDIRDLWVDHPFMDLNRFNRTLNGYWEKKILHFADAVIVVTPGQKKFLSQKYDFLQDKLHLITNGYDPEDIPKVKDRRKEKELTFTFAGSFYKNLSPKIFLDILAQKKEYPIKVRFIGNFRNHFWELINQFPEHDNITIEVIERQPKNTLHKYLKSSDILLIFVPYGKIYEGILTTKLFDYLPYQKPILAFCPACGDLAKFIERGKLGFTAGSKEQGKEILDKIIQLHRNNRLFSESDEEFIAQYTRQAATEKLVNVLEKIV